MTNFELEIERLANRVIPLERFVHFLAARLERPYLFRGSNERGFRYETPDYCHFCLLRSSRMVSALNASIGLAKDGYVQEIAVLLRTIIEYSSQVDYVLLHRANDGVPTGRAATFVSSFFEDSRRTGGEASKKRMKLNQKDVHDAVGKNLDEFNSEIAKGKKASELMSNVYIAFSNYVHGRYPETMDLYGGRPGRFHLRGMRGTPKDSENIETIDTFITTVSNSLIQVTQGLHLRDAVCADDVLADWYLQGVGATA